MRLSDTLRRAARLTLMMGGGWFVLSRMQICAVDAAADRFLWPRPRATFESPQGAVFNPEALWLATQCSHTIMPLVFQI